MGPGTDVGAIARYYEETVRRLETEFPNLKIITITAPLTTTPVGLKARIREMRGKTLWSEEGNVERNMLNDMLRERFGEAVFDLAAYEATRSSGEKAVFKENGGTYPMLNPAYTDDGGHLNEAGRAAIAAELLIFLADRSVPAASSDARRP